MSGKPMEITKGREGHLKSQGRWLRALFLAPTLAWLLVAQALPLLVSVLISFLKWTLSISLEPKGLNGLSNYTTVLADPVFQHSLYLSTILLMSVAVELVVGFCLAYLTLGDHLLSRLARTGLMLPMAIASVAVGIMWRLALNSSWGFVDHVLGLVGITGPNWLGSPDWAVIAVVLIDIWQWTPFAMIIYVGALSGINQELIAAARIDGCGIPQLIRHILVPLTIPATILILVFRLVESFLTVDLVYSLAYGGPGFSTNTVGLYIYYQGLRFFNYGQAAAASWIVTLVCLILAAVFLRLQRRSQEAIEA